jgi:high-affinity nickel permease
LQPLWILLGALGFGAAHAFEPDHMAAVSTFVAKRPTPREAAMFGVKWAIGHGFSLLLFGSLLYVLRRMLENQQPAIFSSGILERVVGVVLIGLGVWTLIQERVVNNYRAKKKAEIDAQIRAQVEAENAKVRDLEVPLFGKPGEVVTRAPLTGAELLTEKSNKHGSLLMGMLHGAAGTGAFIVQAANSQAASSYWMVFGFTVMFSIGVLLAMALYAGVLGGAITWGGRRGTQFIHFARGATGVLACVVGVCLLLEIEIPWVHFA